MPSVSPNMGLRVWDSNDDTFESDHLASNFNKLDFHDHSGGRGVQIPTEGFKDLAITSAKLANAATLKGTGAFSAYRNAALNAVATGTEIIFDTEEFDLSTWFDNGNGRFTPQVAGYYRVNAVFSTAQDLVASAWFELGFTKNGTIVKNTLRHTQQSAATPPTTDFRAGGTTVIAVNGTTDYISVKLTSSAAVDTLVGATNTYFQGELIGRS